MGNEEFCAGMRQNVGLWCPAQHFQMAAWLDVCRRNTVEHENDTMGSEAIQCAEKVAHHFGRSKAPMDVCAEGNENGAVRGGIFHEVSQLRGKWLCWGAMRGNWQNIGAFCGRKTFEHKLCHFLACQRSGHSVKVVGKNEGCCREELFKGEVGHA